MKCSLKTLTISFTKHIPPKELSSTLPTNGDTYAAPALAASIACDGEKINVTLIFDAAQAILAAKAGAKYVSPFVGRLDDNSITGLDLIKDISDIYKIQNVYDTEILSASIRYVNSVSQSFANGANVVTMPPAVFEKMYNHILTEKGLQLFDEDWKQVAEKIA